MQPQFDFRSQFIHCPPEPAAEMGLTQIDSAEALGLARQFRSEIESEGERHAGA
jgi:hypothetical protein